MNMKIKKEKKEIKMSKINNIIIVDGRKYFKKDIFKLFINTGRRSMSITTFSRLIDEYLIKGMNIFTKEELFKIFKQIENKRKKIMDKILNSRINTKANKEIFFKKVEAEAEMKKFDVKNILEGKNLYDIEAKTGISIFVLRSLLKGNYKATKYILEKLKQYEGKE